MEVPENISAIVKTIDESEGAWKAIYMAAWGYSKNLDCIYPRLSWDKNVSFGLPGSKEKVQWYTKQELYDILTSRDVEFTFDHLLRLFSFFEGLVKESSDCFDEKADTWSDMKQFLLDHSLLSPSELDELNLAKETRNCIIHNGSKVDKRWLNAHEKARGKSKAKEDDLITDALIEWFHQIEKWHKLIVEKSHAIVKKIEEK